ncbi:MAG: hypothetical protein LBH47_00345, partial [Christensenellaceae bacterium]|nr:hypothetical protein [Christensenellaceae bacterium]
MMLTDLGKAFANTVSLVGHSISQLIGQFIYLIWTAIARFADALESIFLRLAGVQVKDGDDLASNMINNPQIQQLFWNLVAVSTAIMIFFTIIKIVQENYKEKNGGNPYVIVFRMFKGMLMFFFVTGAVLVGLMASGVVFTLLKDATGSGSQKVSGTIFNAMAYDANRARLGKSFGATDYDKIYYDKIVGIWNGDEEAFGEKKGQYRWIANDASMLYKLTSQGVKVRTASEVAADTYADLLKYAIVNGDGSYQSVIPGLKLQSIGTLDENDADGDGMGVYWTTNDSVDGFGSFTPCPSSTPGAWKAVVQRGDGDYTVYYRSGGVKEEYKPTGYWSYYENGNLKEFVEYKEGQAAVKGGAY